MPIAPLGVLNLRTALVVRSISATTLADHDERYTCVPAASFGSNATAKISLNPRSISASLVPKVAEPFSTS